MPAGTSILFHNDTSNDIGKASGSVPRSIPILGGIGSKGRKSAMETAAVVAGDRALQDISKNPVDCLESPPRQH
jgi:hypothetical protein